MNPEAAPGLPFWIGLALAGLLAACGTPEPPKAPPPPAPVAAAGQRLLTVTDANAGAAVGLEPAQELVVRLPIGVTAGLEWSLVDLKPGVLTLFGTKFERTARDANPSEAAGTMAWHFRPQATGVVTLNFELRRPHSLQAPARAVSYDVTVR